MTRALLLIDIQNGFCPGGNLPVAGGDEVVPVANALMASGKYDLVVASQDWHPPGHGSFASSHPGKTPFKMGELSGKPQMLWPDHCVQGTEDAAFHPDLDVSHIDHVQRKGQNPAVDSYSAFRDNDRAALTGLTDYLKAKGVSEVDICGLATDYCVKFSAIDAVEMLPGVKVRFIEDASRGIDPEGVKTAIAEMREKGVEIVRSADILP
ncbi:bifunctional nicotinamidase/pyrazinamidase [Ciceribacter ferrooxidans]|uniref:Nicotinamidase n=1 Tax=Ciceribacter ferrooxidans TaxID=2509717 RepID=A0A4Q2T0L5_9HYPH|nr:bifunctional nicotinamidase/pyrazinamidase [Ciceribacter ferrooxidans]RYC12115.1 bifunctional nicotinamidase/pyrazinamidase [Ciceribacter ferrooxidans]